VLTSEFLVEVNDALRGTDDDAPTFGDDEANYWVRILNRKKRELYEDVTQTWANTFDGTRTLGTISASATPTFDTEDDFLAPSDKVYVVTTEDQVVEYNVIKPQERLRFRREVYIAGMDPQVLYFSKEINEDENIVGGTLFLPGYYRSGW
jgi:hypothetical protein